MTLPAVAPAFLLANVTSQKPASWSSSDQGGEYSLALLVLGQTGDQQRPSLVNALNSTQPEPSAVERALIASDKSLLLKLRADNAANTALLWDVKNLVPSKLDLQNSFGIAPDQSALVIIDRAGWLRSVEKIEGSEQLAARLQTLTDPTPKLEVDKPAPDFAMRDANGVLRHLSDLKGKKNLLLTFFPKCFTFTCKAQLSSINDAKAGLQQNDVEVWAVSVDPADGERGQRAFAKSLNTWFPFLPDTGRNICLLYDAVKSPNQMATRMSVFIGKDGTVKWIDKQINPKTHGADVVARMREMKAAP